MFSTRWMETINYVDENNNDVRPVSSKAVIDVKRRSELSRGNVSEIRTECVRSMISQCPQQVRGAV